MKNFVHTEVWRIVHAMEEYHLRKIAAAVVVGVIAAIVIVVIDRYCYCC